MTAKSCFSALGNFCGHDICWCWRIQRLVKYWGVLMCSVDNYSYWFLSSLMAQDQNACFQVFSTVSTVWFFVKMYFSPTRIGGKSVTGLKFILGVTSKALSPVLSMRVICFRGSTNDSETLIHGILCPKNQSGKIHEFRILSLTHPDYILGSQRVGVTWWLCHWNIRTSLSCNLMICDRWCKIDIG